MQHSVCLTALAFASLGPVQQARAARVLSIIDANISVEASGKAGGNQSISEKTQGPPWPHQISANYDKPFYSYLMKDICAEQYFVTDKITKYPAVVQLLKLGTQYLNPFSTAGLGRSYREYLEAEAHLGGFQQFCEAKCIHARLMTEIEGIGRLRYRLCYESGMADPTNQYMVMEYIGQEGTAKGQYLGSLRTWRDSFGRKFPPVADLTRIIKQVLEGIRHIEGKYVHRDVLDHEIFLEKRADGKLYVRIGGLVGMETPGNHGSQDSMAGLPSNHGPETIGYLFGAKGEYEVAHSMDIYAIGVLIFRMMCADKSQRKIKNWGINTVVEDGYKQDTGGAKFGFHKDNSLLIKKFEHFLNGDGPIKNCRNWFPWEPEYEPLMQVMKKMLGLKESRPTATKLLQEEIFQTVEEDDAGLVREVQWVVDHLAQQKEFEAQREKVFDETYEKHVKIDRTHDFRGERVFDEQCKKDFMKDVNLLDANPVHIME